MKLKVRPFSAELCWLAVISLLVPILQFAGNAIQKVLSFANNGSDFVFSPGENDHYMAFRVQCNSQKHFFHQFLRSTITIFCVRRSCQYCYLPASWSRFCTILALWDGLVISVSYRVYMQHILVTWRFSESSILFQSRKLGGLSTLGKGEWSVIIWVILTALSIVHELREGSSLSSNRSISVIREPVMCPGERYPVADCQYCTDSRPSCFWTHHFQRSTELVKEFRKIPVFPLNCYITLLHYKDHTKSKCSNLVNVLE